MSKENINQLKPFFSVVLIIFTLFTIVFLQMEERRMGYSVLKLTRDYKKNIEEKRVREIALAKVTRPQLLDHMAQSKFTLKKVQANQIIHLSGPLGHLGSATASAGTVEKVVSYKKDL